MVSFVCRNSYTFCTIEVNCSIQLGEVQSSLGLRSHCRRDTGIGEGVESVAPPLFLKKDDKRFLDRSSARPL